MIGGNDRIPTESSHGEIGGKREGKHRETWKRKVENSVKGRETNWLLPRKRREEERETEEIQYPGGFYAYGGYEYVVDYFLYALHVHE